MKLVSLNFDNHVVAVKAEELEEALDASGTIDYRGTGLDYAHNPYGPAIVSLEYTPYRDVQGEFYLEGRNLSKSQWEKERHKYLFPDKFNELLNE